ncbi:MAG: hypothetical protein E6Q48_04120 [Limnohabitans sp.]|nr:MAG: hypothetical protein E6Q48_04120 [Limnohabitans sp.]
MKKINSTKKTLIAAMVTLASLTATTDVWACKRWDVACKAREAVKRARERAEEEARRVQQAAQQAQQVAQAQADAAKRAAEQAAALAAQQAAAAKAAEEEALKAATEAANRLAELARQQSPISPSEAMNFANSRLNQVTSTAQGVALSSLQATASGMTRVGNDINSAFRNVGDELESELKKLNVDMPDVAGFAQEAMKPAINELKSFDAFRRTMSSNFGKLSKEDIGNIWGIMRTVMEQKRPSDEQIEDFQEVMKDLFGDISNGCQICPKTGPAGVGIGLTVASPTAGQIPLGASVTFSLVQSTYLVNGKPLFVAGYTVNAEATSASRPTPEVSLDVVWAPGQLSTSKLPSATLSVSMSTPAVETAYGSYSGGGSVGLVMPDTVYMFFDKNERRKLLAALKDVSKGPKWVVEKANAAITDLRKMVMNPAYEAGISVGMPGSGALKLKPDGGLVMSLSGVIGAF